MMKNCIFIITILLTFACSSRIFAQQGEQAKVILKNGVKISGGIVGTFDEDKIDIVLSGSERLLIRYDHIKKIRFRKYGALQGDISNKIQEPPSLGLDSYFHEIRGSLLFGEENLGIGLNTINGYQFSKFLGAGLGIGINKYGNYLAVPIYAQVRGYLYDRKVSPFYFGDIGYGQAWNNDKNNDVFKLDNVKGGLYWQVGLGYQINFYNNSLTLALGYINQDSRADYVYYRPWDIDDVEVSERRVLRRVKFSVGILF